MAGIFLRQINALFLPWDASGQRSTYLLFLLILIHWAVPKQEAMSIVPRSSRISAVFISLVISAPGRSGDCGKQVSDGKSTSLQTRHFLYQPSERMKKETSLSPVTEMVSCIRSINRFSLSHLIEER